MNRALLERMNTYQPRPGIAARSPSAFNVAFWMLAVPLIFVVVWSVLLLVEGCSPAATPATPEAAEATYLTDHLACVERYETRTAIDACRDGVRARWGRPHRDGGK